LLIFLFSALLLGFLASSALAKSPHTCLVYFTGVGCPHCAKADPVVLEELPEKYPDLVVVEYEIYQEKENAPIFYQYCENYNIPLNKRGIPFVLFGKDNYFVGDTPILKNLEEALGKRRGNPCPLIDGTAADFENLEPASLPGKPKILARYQSQTAGVQGGEAVADLTPLKVLSLAATDAVNPCALAVLVLTLIAILTYNPKRRRNLLLAGLAFSLSVFVMYFLYGLVIVRFFQLVQALAGVKLWLYKILGFAAIILGILNLKDFIRYKPGGILTEMPMFLRPKMQNLLFKLTSPRGAFGVGALVTIFLLPCTIGPYVICGGILCSLSLPEILPWLLLYNLVFILPMLVITFVCYAGFTTVENVSGWRDKNIRYLHLFAGLVIFGLGVAMVLGLL